MLLAQSFDPFKEQERKLPFFARCRFISRTRRALSEFKNKMHENIANRHMQALMARDPRYMMAATTTMQQIAPPPHPQQQPWYGGCCYDPYFNSPPPPPLMMLPPPPPLLAPPYPMHPQQVPYCICVHLSSPPQTKSATYNSPSSSTADSTLYSSNSSMYSGEKELVEDVEYEHPVHPLQETNYLTRRNSDILHDRQRTRRPSLHRRRWNTSDSHSVYYH